MSELSRDGVAILVTDDDPESADALTAKLRLEGFSVLTAYSGAEALALAEGMHPNAVLLDVSMPGMTGHDVAREIRRTTWGRAVRLIAITGRDTPNQIRESQEAGFDYHLVKPVDYPTLLQLLIDADV